MTGDTLALTDSLFAQGVCAVFNTELIIHIIITRPTVCTVSCLITEVKQHWAGLVLGWVTAWEYPVL